MAKLIRTKRLNIRLSDKEFALVASKADGMSLARYARAILTTGRVNRRQRDFPIIDPKLMREIRSMGKNVNQLVRYIHSEAKAKHPIDTLTLALSIDRFSQALAELKQQYEVQVVANDFDSEPEDEEINAVGSHLNDRMDLKESAE